ncbi:MAG: host attachment protein [Inhella sp.]|jgi:protein required for attachment to host cells|uniref:host attachment protein n=1 Tax=Inhella sp. TaxID=1921806 RepID=UPI0022BCE5CF|nr:host attachment protein [Inhella sp.]MCZ8233964.1 host attachment protein [Inhella sp.]
MGLERQVEAATVPALDWLVVANAAWARVYERDAAQGAMRERFSKVHEEGRAQGGALGRGRPGRVRKGVMSTAFEPHTHPRERERTRFARALAALLEREAVGHRMAGLVLLVSNPFLGDLRAALGPASRAVLKGAWPVDVTGLQGAELEHRVSQLLHLHLQPLGGGSAS